MTTAIPDSEVNAWLKSLMAAGYEEDGIDAALDSLLASPAGRASLVQHLADFAVLALDSSLPDARRGRILRRYFAPPVDETLPPTEPNPNGPNVVDDGSIVRYGVGGWNR